MRITVLTDVEDERDDPRASDEVVPQVADALAAAGHRVDVLGVYADVRRFVAALDERRPELVFNLLGSFGDDLNGDIARAADSEDLREGAAAWAARRPPKFTGR